MKLNLSINSLTLILIFNMKPATILYELRELRDSWRKQSFKYTSEQQKKYDELLKLRRERVKEMYANDQVYKGAGTK